MAVFVLLRSPSGTEFLVVPCASLFGCLLLWKPRGTDCWWRSASHGFRSPKFCRLLRMHAWDSSSRGSGCLLGPLASFYLSLHPSAAARTRAQAGSGIREGAQACFLHLRTERPLIVMSSRGHMLTPCSSEAVILSLRQPPLAKW